MQTKWDTGIRNKMIRGWVGAEGVGDLMKGGGMGDNIDPQKVLSVSPTRKSSSDSDPLPTAGNSWVFTQKVLGEPSIPSIL